MIDWSTKGKTMTTYPYYSVEGRRWNADEFQLAVFFARHMANKMQRPVHVISKLDHMTAAAVIYTAEPDPKIFDLEKTSCPD
jgi:hypothetical protein